MRRSEAVYAIGAEKRVNDGLPVVIQVR